AGCDINAHSGARSTPLMVAAFEDVLGVAEVLIRAGAALNVANNNGKSALALSQSKKMRELLQAAGADEKQTVPLPPGPIESLVLAAGDGDRAKTQELLAAGVPVGAFIRFGHTPLHSAVVGCQLDMVRLLLDKGADIHQRLADGDTLLHTATWADSIE